MRFLRVDPLRLTSHPGWRSGTAQETSVPLTPEELVPHGFFPVVDEPPEYNPLRQRRVVRPLDEWEITETFAIKGYSIEDISLEEAKATKLGRLANRRWEAEENGTTLGSTPIATDRVTQGKVTAAYVKAQMDENYSIPSWKLPSGDFMTLDATTIIAIGDAIEAHVQACFANENALSSEIVAAEDYDELEAIDINVGWP